MLDRLPGAAPAHCRAGGVQAELVVVAGSLGAAVAFAVAEDAGTDGYAIVLHCLVQADLAVWSTGDVADVLAAFAGWSAVRSISSPRPPRAARGDSPSGLVRLRWYWPPSRCAALCPLCRPLLAVPAACCLGGLRLCRPVLGCLPASRPCRGRGTGRTGADQPG
ncbi:hypothetical protein GZL_00137 [Streptomyces sp. 769]|nr:hypothetical protein GZL_00137 [Streptomyces sp. 769]